MQKFFLTACAAILFSSGVSASPISSSAFFTGSDTTLDFESLGPDLIVNLTTQFQPLGVTFSGEATPGGSQATDAADATNRFNANLRAFDISVLAGTGGGAPTSGSRYVGPSTFGFLGRDMSDIRFDFADGVHAFGMQVIDNDFSVGRLQAFDAFGVLLETLVLPQVGEGGVAFHGIDVTGTGNSIAYAILDGNNGLALDSTLIDDFSFRSAPSPVPLPAGGLLLLSGLAGVVGLKRRKKRAA